MFEKVFNKNKPEKKKKSSLEYLIAKSEAGDTLNDLDELLNCEAFSDEQAKQVDAIMKQLDFLDDETSSAIGDLLLAVTSQIEVVKYCEVGWPSLSGQALVEIPCLIEKAELNSVETFIQSFCTKAEVEDAELEIVSKALETISDLDEASLQAVKDLLKVEFSKNTIAIRWPAFFHNIETQQVESSGQPVAKKKSGLKWPSISGRF